MYTHNNKVTVEDKLKAALYAALLTAVMRGFAVTVRCDMPVKP